MKTVHRQIFDIAFIHLIQNRIKEIHASMRISKKFIIFAPECILIVRKCFQMFINCVVLSRDDI